MLRRNHPAAPAPAISELERLAANAARADGMPRLLGTEGAAARVYFAVNDDAKPSHRSL